MQSYTIGVTTFFYIIFYASDLKEDVQFTSYTISYKVLSILFIKLAQ